jgi:putative peptidoglycan lipid II flippase
MNSGEKIAKSSAIIMFGYSFSRILGYLRLKALAYVFGSNYQTDAYVAVHNIIDILYLLLAGGALSAAFIPVFTEYLVKEKKEEAYSVASSIANILIIASLAGILIWEFFTPFFVKIVAPGFDEKTNLLCSYLTRITLPMVIFTVLSALLSGILNSYQHFTAPSLAFIFYNIPIIIFTFFLGPKIGIVSVPYGVLLGSFLLVAIQVPFLIKKGVKYKFILDYKSEGVRKIIKLFIPAMLGLSLSQINLILIPQFFASYFSDGVITYLNYANRIIMLPFGIFAVAISTAVFPTLSREIQENRKKDFQRTLSRAISSTFFFSLPSTFGLIILSNEIIKLLYWGGEFSLKDVKETGEILAFFSIGLFALSAIQVLTRGFYSQQDTSTPVKVGFVSLFINLGLCYSLGKSSLKENGLPLATSLTSLFNMSVLTFILRDKLNFKILFSSFSKSLFSSLGMGIFIFILNNILKNFLKGGFLSLIFLKISILMFLGGIVYFIFSLILKSEDSLTIFKILKKF